MAVFHYLVYYGCTMLTSSGTTITGEGTIFHSRENRIGDLDQKEFDKVVDELKDTILNTMDNRLIKESYSVVDDGKNIVFKSIQLIE